MRYQSESRNQVETSGSMRGPKTTLWTTGMLPYRSATQKDPDMLVPNSQVYGERRLAKSIRGSRQPRLPVCLL